MKFKTIYALLVIFFVIILSISVLTGGTMYVQFVHLLLPPSGSRVAAAQFQPSKNPTLPSPSTSSSSATTTSSLPDVFQRVENSVVQITSTKFNPNELIIINGVPETGRSTALGSGFVYDNQGHIITNCCTYTDR